MVPQPETHYVKGPEGNIAYQVFGDGPIDLVIVPGWLSHVDLLWQEPGWVTLMSEITSFARVIRYDKIGTMLKGVPGQWQLFAPAGQLTPVDYHVPVKRRGFQAFMADRISRRPRIAHTVLRMSYRR